MLPPTSPFSQEAKPPCITELLKGGLEIDPDRPAVTSATQDLFREGWLDSGDVMKADQDGYLYFRGRKKQIIVHDGSNISPQEIEEVLLEYPGVESAGVIGIHDLVHGENVRAYVTIKSGVPLPTSQELIQFARSKVGYKAPDEIIFLEKMPATASGKVNRTELKKMAEANIHNVSDGLPQQPGSTSL